MFDVATLKQEAYRHLEYFHILVPALTINFIEKIIVIKGSVTKKATPGVYISDDGFALGVVYLLKVFRQTNEFEQLNWFASVKNRFEEELLQGDRKDEKKNSKVVNWGKTEVMMNHLKSEAYQREMEWLYYVFTASFQVLKSD